MLDGLLGDDGEPVPATGQVVRDNNVIFTAFLHLENYITVYIPCMSL